MESTAIVVFMTHSLQELVTNFESLNDNNARVVVCRLKKKKLKYETALKQIQVILNAYRERKEKKFKQRIEKNVQRYRESQTITEEETTLSLKRNCPWLFDENGNFKT